MQTILDEKKEIRARCLSLRTKIGRHKAAAAAEAIIDPLLEYVPEYVKIIAGYMPMRGEINILPAMKRLEARGYLLCMPVVVAPAAPLVFRQWQFGDKTEKGMLGVRVPLAVQPEIIPDMVIAPLAAFDGEGRRIGYGGGYYDRTILGLRDPQKNFTVIGAAYAIQQVPRIPSGARDQRLDAVATEQGVTIFR